MIAIIMTAIAITQQASKAHRRGFSLLEILIVIALIGGIAGLIIANLDVIFGENQIKTARIFVDDSIKTPLTAYRVSMGRYPSTEEGLQALLKAPADDKGRWRGPYVEKLPQDPWGHPYQYRCPGVHNPQKYDIWSNGPDGAQSEDDIGNW